MKNIFFSPLGSTDPIASMRDGAMLHILRKYDFDEIYLFYSKEMCELEDADNRYMYCIKGLEELTGKSFDKIVKVKRPDLVDVHIFDEMLLEFRDILEEISKGEECEIVLNVSSGTPAMKSALQVISATSENVKMIPIQVASPAKAYNRNREDVKGDYDVETQWEFNLDNVESEYEDRCTVSSNLNLASEMKKNLIKNFVDSYDYVAALDIAKDMGSFVSEETVDLLNALSCRIKLDSKGVKLHLKNTGFKMLPHETSSECGVFEYLMLCRIKIIKEEYADFLRSISPLFFALLERILEKHAGINLQDYLYDDYNRNRGVNGTIFKKWDVQKVEHNDLLVSALTNDGKKELRNQVVGTAHLVDIIRRCRIDAATQKNIDAIRAIEEKVRNPVAHCITYVTEDVIKNATGFTANKIFDMLKNLTIQSGMKITDNDMRTYEICNEEVKKYLI